MQDGTIHRRSFTASPNSTWLHGSHGTPRLECQSSTHVQRWQRESFDDGLMGMMMMRNGLCNVVSQKAARVSDGYAATHGYDETSDESVTGVCRKSEDDYQQWSVYLGVLPSVTWLWTN
jgi:hypothetical protein